MSNAEKTQAMNNMLESFKHLDDVVKQGMAICQTEAAKYDKVKEEGSKRPELTAMMESLANITSIIDERMK